MTITIVCGFLGGFFAGNGAPYYFAGSIGEPTNPSPFADSALVNVVVGWVALLIGALCLVAASRRGQPWVVAAAAALGVLVVGLIHARLWRRDPWRKK